MSIDKYIISECHVYTPFEIQEGYHNADQNLGSTIKVDYDALPDYMKKDEAKREEIKRSVQIIEPKRKVPELVDYQIKIKDKINIVSRC